MASVRKRKWTHNGVEKEAWVIAYVDRSGKRRQETFDKKKDADRRRQKIEEELNAGLHVASADGVTVAKACEDFINLCDARMKAGDRMTRSTYKQYRDSSQKVIAEFGARNIQSIQANEIEAWLLKLGAQHKKSSVQHYAYILRAVIALAVKNRHVGRNIMVESAVRLPQMTSSRISIPTIAELQLLMDCLSERQYDEREAIFVVRKVIIRLGVFCGLRAGEIAGLNWEDIDPVTKRIHIKRNYSQLNGLKAPKTWAGDRVIYTTRSVLDALEELRRHRGGVQTGPVCITLRGKRMLPAAIWVHYKSVCKRCGLLSDDGGPKYHLHALRHAAVSLLIREGVSPLHIKRMVGHAKVSTTMNVYGHLFPEDESLRSGIDKIADAFAKRQESNKATQVIEGIGV